MPRWERALEKMEGGEIRWSDREGGWEIFIPAVAFENARSSFETETSEIISSVFFSMKGYSSLLMGKGSLLASITDPGGLA